MKQPATSPAKRARMRLSALWRDERGTTTIEFVLASLPIFVIFLVAIEFGLDMTVDATVQIAAQAASRAGMATMTAQTGQSAPTVQTIATQTAMKYLQMWQNIGANVTVTRTDYTGYGGTAASGSTYCGNVESYVIQVSNVPAFTGVASLLGLSPPTYQRNFIVQNVCTTS